MIADAAILKAETNMVVFDATKYPLFGDISPASKDPNYVFTDLNLASPVEYEVRGTEIKNKTCSTQCSLLTHSTPQHLPTSRALTTSPNQTLKRLPRQSSQISAT
jgi:hypothetical protein